MHFFLRYVRFAVPLLCLCVQTLALASHSTRSFGDIAHAINEPLTSLSYFVRTICWIAGIGLLVGSIIRLHQHRRNPVQVTLGSVFSFLLGGLALITLTFIPIPK